MSAVELEGVSSCVAHRTIGRKQAVEQILGAADRVGPWWARDFKPGRSPDDLTWTQFTILCLADQPPINLSQLAERLDLSVPTVVRAVDALERKQLVVRKRLSPQRDVTVELTPEGVETRDQTKRIRSQRLLELLRRLSDEEVASLVLGFQALARAVQEDGRAR